jgi:hypothetical protein
MHIWMNLPAVSVCVCVCVVCTAPFCFTSSARNLVSLSDDGCSRKADSATGQVTS